MLDVVVREEPAGADWVAFVEMRRDLPARAMCRTLVLPGEQAPDLETMVMIMVPIKGGKGNEIFDAIRKALVDDVDRVGSVYYARGPEVIMVENRASVADYWARIVRSLDADQPAAGPVVPAS